MKITRYLVTILAALTLALGLGMSASVADHGHGSGGQGGGQGSGGSGGGGQAGGQGGQGGHGGHDDHGGHGRGCVARVHSDDDDTVADYQARLDRAIDRLSGCLDHASERAADHLDADQAATVQGHIDADQATLDSLSDQVDAATTSDELDAVRSRLRAFHAGNYRDAIGALRCAARISERIADARDEYAGDDDAQADLDEAAQLVSDATDLALT